MDKAANVVFKTHHRKLRYSSASGKDVFFSAHGVLEVPNTEENADLIKELRAIKKANGNVWEDLDGNAKPDHLSPEAVATPRRSARLDPLTGTLKGVVSTASQEGSSEEEQEEEKQEETPPPPPTANRTLEQILADKKAGK